MYFTPLLLATAALASPIVKRAGQTVFKFPLANGFPALSASALAEVEKQAQGTIPNIQLPTSIGDDTALVWQLIAVNEIFEVAYFTSLISNITNKVPGYETDDQVLINSLNAIVAQEQLHATAANAILQTAGRETVAPCEYVFPVDNLKDAVAFAQTFTDLVLGTLQTALTAFGLDKDDEFLSVLGSVIGQEGGQVGYFRTYAGKVASAQPFLTTGGAVFANSALSQLVIVPGSCPAALPIPTLKPLTVTPGAITAKTQTIRFTYPGTEYEGYALSYLNGQNKPYVYPITNAEVSNGEVTFTTEFQYDQNLLNGLTIAAIVKGTGALADTAAVQAAAIAGPALIEIN